jgi:hypothetical protein
VLVGENSDLYAAKGSDLNRTSSGRLRPSPGGKYINYKKVNNDADNNYKSVSLSTIIKSYNLKSTSTTSKLASFYPSPSQPPQANRIRRSVVNINNNNQHGNDAPTSSISTVVDVVSHASLTSLHDHQNHEQLEEGSGSSDNVDEHVASASSALQVQKPHAQGHAVAPIEHVSTTDDDTITAEELAEELGSGFLLSSSAESVQHDSPVYAYGVDDVEIVHLDRGGNVPSPDANKLNNEVKEVLSLTRIKPAGSNKNETSDLGGSFKLIKNETLINGSVPVQVEISSTVQNRSIIHFIKHDAPETSEELQSGIIPHHHKIVSSHVHQASSSDIRRSATEDSLHGSVVDASQHGLSVPLTPTARVNDEKHHHRIVEHFNTSSRHMKRVLVNVTIATEDADSDESSSSESSSQSQKNHHPMYVLSVSVPTDAESKTSANLTHNASIVLGLSENPSLLVDLGQQQQINSNQEILKQKVLKKPTTTVVPGINYWGGECQCSCPCLDDSNENQEGGETTPNPVTEQDSSKTEENKNQTTPERLVLEVLREERENETLDSSLETIGNKTSVNSSTIIDDFNSTSFTESEEAVTSEVASEQTTEDQLSSSSSTSTVEDAYSTTTTEAVSSSTSEVQCTTPTPPPPVVLILEGERENSK